VLNVRNYGTAAPAIRLRQKPLITFSPLLAPTSLLCRYRIHRASDGQAEKPVGDRAVDIMQCNPRDGRWSGRRRNMPSDGSRDSSFANGHCAYPVGLGCPRSGAGPRPTGKRDTAPWRTRSRTVRRKPSNSDRVFLQFQPFYFLALEKKNQKEEK
jgi:hypothetical protein